MYCLFDFLIIANIFNGYYGVTEARISAGPLKFRISPGRPWISLLASRKVGQFAFEQKFLPSMSTPWQLLLAELSPLALSDRTDLRRDLRHSARRSYLWVLYKVCLMFNK